MTATPEADANAATPAPRRSVAEALAVYLKPRVLIVLLLGFSSGLPLALSGSTLAVWLMAAYPMQLIVAACIRRAYGSILLIPLYLVRGPVESVTAVLGLIDCLRHQRTWYQAERPAAREVG